MNRPRPGCLALALVAVVACAKGGMPAPANDLPPGGMGGVAGAPEAPPHLGDKITSVTVSADAVTGAPATVFVTFAQPFKPADVPAGATLVGRTPDGADVDLQVDAKATHADGSLRHAVITARLPALPSGGSIELGLFTRAGSASDPPAAVAAKDLLATPFDVTVSLALAGVGGRTFRASARRALNDDASRTWLSGPLVTEWSLAVPLDAGTEEHAHLAAHFDVRAYAGLATVVVGVTIENDWAFEPGPQNFTYDATIATDRGVALSAPALVHFRQARWRHTLLWGDAGAAKANVKHDVKYLLATGALPNFDPTVTAQPEALAELDAKLTPAATAPLGIGLAAPYMPETGGRGDIGPLPAWVALYVISQDARARRATLATADRAGSWSIHYRDKVTGRPVSLDDHPYMTLLGNPSDACDPKTKKCDAFPDCAGDCASPYTPDSAHQPAFTYVPYLLTGDRYYLEELQFWANWNMLQANPGYRDHARGLVHWDQPRGQGWSMRTLGQTAYVTPDADPMKKYFVDRVAYNLAWYDQEYSHNPAANPFGYVDAGSTIGADGTLAPWMDDFFTWSIGHLVALGFEDARPLRDWKVKFAIGRMNDPGYCWIFASAYHMAVRDPTTRMGYATWGEIYGPTLVDADKAAARSLRCGSPEMAAALALRPGEMIGYSDSPEGYPSNLQPALAIAADSGVVGGKAAWDRFAARSVKPDHSREPQFAIVPR
jgi:hypothetical protein